VKEELSPATVEIIWKKDEKKEYHPNALEFEVADKKSDIDKWLVYSVGGGKIVDDREKDKKPVLIYNERNMQEILDFYKKTGKTFWELVFETEGEAIKAHLAEVWRIMQAAISEGLAHEGLIQGGLKLQRKAASYYSKSKSLSGYAQISSRIFSYALAVSEQNASGGKVVTAPTCGSSGILPAVLKITQEQYGLEDEKIIRALATAGLVGNIVKHNASISGAEVGCQGEVGSACAMAAAGLAEVLGGSPGQVENAAEIGLEHNLGLTCDPVGGLVQVPCIERNAIASVKAINAARMALHGDGEHFISLDKVIRTMRDTGRDMQDKYKETSKGGLAVNAIEC